MMTDAIFQNKKAVIWDMDGVLSDTQKFHAQVESLLLHSFQIEMTPEEITKKYSGVSDEAMFTEIFQTYSGKTPNLQEIIAKKWDLMKEVARGKITAIPHAVPLIKKMKKNKLKLAIASASTKAFILDVLRSLEVFEYFDVLVSAQEVEHGKPAPDIFLLAAKKMRVEPYQCVVIEDGVSGMIGAKKTGMASIGFVSSGKKDVPADFIVRSLVEIGNLLEST